MGKQRCGHRKKSAESKEKEIKRLRVDICLLTLSTLSTLITVRNKFSFALFLAHLVVRNLDNIALDPFRKKQA